MKDTYVDGEKLARNGRKMTKRKWGGKDAVVSEGLYFRNWWSYDEVTEPNSTKASKILDISKENKMKIIIT